VESAEAFVIGGAFFNITAWLGDRSLTASGHGSLRYNSDDYFPATGVLGDVWAITALGFEVGMDVMLSVQIAMGQEPYAAKIATMAPAAENSDQLRIEVAIRRPTNIPICKNRVLIQSVPYLRALVGEQFATEAPWQCVQVFTGLTADAETIELPPDNWLVLLDLADTLELQQFFVTGVTPAMYNPMLAANLERKVGAICMRTCTEDERSQSGQLLTALRLFREGFLYLGPDIHFSENGWSNSPGVPWVYTSDQVRYVLKAEDAKRLQDWIALFRGLTIEPDSRMARAIRRFERTYVGAGELYDRITDAMIGLETLLAPERAPEILYRVSQRAAFFLSDDPLERLEIDRQVKIGYGVRSGVVHSASGGEDATEELASKCQDFLRRCTNRILLAHPDLANEYCRETKDDKRKEQFVKAAVFYGGFEQALKAWLT
jgi:hypothetical protein